MKLSKENVERYIDKGTHLFDISKRFRVSKPELLLFMNRHGIKEKEQVIARIPRSTASNIYDSHTVTLEDLKRGLGL